MGSRLRAGLFRPSFFLRRTRIKKRWLANLLLLVGGFILGLLIVEVALRLLGYSYPNLYTTDQYRGFALRPGAEGWWRREGEAYIRINSEGLRDREHTKQKPPHTLRIAVLGDSYAEALQVPLEKTFWAVLENRLSACERLAERKVEVINFGVSGYGTALELITLRRQVWEYSPDIVLLAFTTGNDISDNSRVLKGGEDVPYFIHRDGQLVLDESYLNSRMFRLRKSTLNRSLRWLRNYSRVAQLAFQAYYAIANRTASGQQQQQGDAPKGAEAGQIATIYNEPGDPVWKDAWRVTEELLLLMRDEVAQRNAKFLVVTLSSGIQVHPDPRLREEFMKHMRISDLFYPDRRIKALGDREGFYVLNLAPSLQTYAEQQKIFLHGFGRNLGGGHWNADGHRVAGEVITQKLCEWFR